jgi:CTP:phosphocholine cytidylyltransferase-like protein
MSLYSPALSLEATKKIWLWHKNIALSEMDMMIEKQDKEDIYNFSVSEYKKLEKESAMWKGCRQALSTFTYQIE